MRKEQGIPKVWEILDKEIIAGKGLTGGGKLNSNPVFNIVSEDEGIIINNDSIKLNIIDDLITGGVKKSLSAEQGKVLKQLIDAIGGGGVTRLLRASEALSEYDYMGSLPANGTSIAVGKQLFDPTLYLDGIRRESNTYSVDLNTGLLILNEPYSPKYDVIWVVEDRMPFHITFCFPTLALLLASNDMKGRIVVGDVIKLLGESDADDGGAYLVKCEDTAKLNAIDIGNGRFLNEIPNTKISTLKSEVEQNKMDILLKANVYNPTFTGQVLFNGGSTTNPKVKHTVYPAIAFESDTNNANIALDSGKGRVVVGGTSGQNGVIFTEGNCPIYLYPNGWVKFANGLIIQWGVGGGYRTTNGYVNLPLTFPNAYKVITSPNGESASVGYYMPIIATELSTGRFWFNIENRSRVTTIDWGEVTTFNWVAIGY